MTDKEKLIKIKSLADKMYNAAFNLTTDASLLRKVMDEYHQFTIYEYHKEEPVSEELEEAALLHLSKYYDTSIIWDEDKKCVVRDFKAGALWQKEHFWKPANGDDLPEIAREVVAFQKTFPTDIDVPSLLKIVMAHRPNPKGYDGKSIATGKVEHYTPKTYDKGGWNIPNVVLWLDLNIPNLEED